MTPTNKDMERAERELDRWLSGDEREDFIAGIASLIAQVRAETLEEFSADILSVINSVANDSKRDQAEQVALIAKYSFARGQIERFKNKETK